MSVKQQTEVAMMDTSPRYVFSPQGPKSVSSVVSYKTVRVQVGAGIGIGAGTDEEGVVEDGGNRGSAWRSVKEFVRRRPRATTGVAVLSLIHI